VKWSQSWEHLVACHVWRVRDFAQIGTWYGLTDRTILLKTLNVDAHGLDEMNVKVRLLYRGNSQRRSSGFSAMPRSQCRYRGSVRTFLDSTSLSYTHLAAKWQNMPTNTWEHLQNGWTFQPKQLIRTITKFPLSVFFLDQTDLPRTRCHSTEQFQQFLGILAKSSPV
jgi:hypothetical protein